ACLDTQIAGIGRDLLDDAHFVGMSDLGANLRSAFFVGGADPHPCHSVLRLPTSGNFLSTFRCDRKLYGLGFQDEVMEIIKDEGDCAYPVGFACRNSRRMY